ncbi:MAG: hypothetical protein FWH11_09035 [Micrococcales bacterium]|nr:hypothetical protein [Micrococcales bacterium]
MSVWPAGALGSDPAADLRGDLAGAIGLQAWGVELGYGSFLLLSFGEHDQAAPWRGEWHLWVYCTFWRIETDEMVYAACEQERERLVDLVRVLEGRTLVGTDVEVPSLSLTLYFSEGLRLHTFSFKADDGADHWMLFLPDGNVRVAGPGPTWAIGPSRKTRGSPPGREVNR